MDVTTGPEGGKGKPVNYNPNDMEYVLGALCYALVEGLKLEDLECILAEVSTGEEFDAGVCATIELNELVREYYEK